jgi:predicted cytidylate kinase
VQRALHRHLCISGELGSGKSSVAARVAGIAGCAVVSTGTIQREMAQQRSLSTLETNRLAESDASIDAAIDGRLIELAGGPPTVFDSRMAWHFVAGALKVHLIIDPRIAADRIFADRRSAVETHESAEAAWASTEQRFTSERTRFQGTYGVDIARLRNYDLVVDSSAADLDRVVALVARWAGLAPDPDPDTDADAVPPPALYLSPARLLPPGPGGAAEGALTVAYARPTFRTVAGHDRAEAATAAGRPLVRAALAGEEAEPLGAGGPSAQDYVVGG